MKFTFAESVKLATKGFKPGDITELSELDENKFNKEDILSLVGNGYSKTDIKKLVETFSDPESEDDNPGDDSETDSHSGKSENKSEHDDHDSEDSDDKDDIDYKELYEKEKKLREKLQQQNQKKGSVVKGDNRTDFEIALDIANNL